MRANVPSTIDAHALAAHSSMPPSVSWVKKFPSTRLWKRHHFLRGCDALLGLAQHWRRGRYVLSHPEKGHTLWVFFNLCQVARKLRPGDPQSTTLDFSHHP